MDEGAALCVEVDESGRVYPLSGGCAWRVMPGQAVTRLGSGQRLEIRSIPVACRQPAAHARLAVEDAEFTAVATVVDGGLELQAHQVGPPGGCSCRQGRG